MVAARVEQLRLDRSPVPLHVVRSPSPQLTPDRCIQPLDGDILWQNVSARSRVIQEILLFEQAAYTAIPEAVFAYRSRDLSEKPHVTLAWADSQQIYRLYIAPSYVGHPYTELPAKKSNLSIQKAISRNADEFAITAQASSKTPETRTKLKIDSRFPKQMTYIANTLRSLLGMPNVSTA